MLFAELHGKLSRNYSRVHERAEDLLTSTAFQMLRYFPAEFGLYPALRRARRVEWHEEGVSVERDPPGWIEETLANTDGHAFEFWPNWRAGGGQPELVITLIGAGRKLGRIVIEVKLDSGKSQLGNGDEDGEEPVAEPVVPRDPDQLSRYWRCLSERAISDGVPALGVIYLTAHATPPLNDLQESLARQPGDWLGWLSWRDVWAVAAAEAGRLLPAQDLANILAHKGLKYFNGFRPPEPLLPSIRVGFWRFRLFTPRPEWKAPTAWRGFWSRNKGTR